MVNKFIVVIALVLGLAGGAIAQNVVKLYTVTSIAADVETGSVQCFKDGGQGVVVYDLYEDGSGEPVDVGCLKEAD